MSQEVTPNRSQRRAASRSKKPQKAPADVTKHGPSGAPKATIMVAYCFNRVVHEAWMMSVFKSIAGLAGEYRFRPVGASSGPLLSRARNLLLTQYLDHTDDTHILFTDTDMIFAADDVRALLDADVPIAAAMYYGGGHDREPHLTALNRLPEDPDTFKTLAEAPTSPVEVDAVGMGLTLIKREVIKALEPIKMLWPFAETDEDHGYGEDITFCIRAAEHGYKPLLIPQARIGHIKDWVL